MIPNQFSWQNTNDWKDLNSKFVLMVWRDYVLTGKKDQPFLKYTWPAVQEAMQYLQHYDRNGDGIPKTTVIPTRLTTSGLCAGRVRIAGGCGSPHCALRRRWHVPWDKSPPRLPTILNSKSSGQLCQQAVEWRILPLRHRQRLQRRYPSRPTSWPVVRELDRTWRSGSP